MAFSNADLSFLPTPPRVPPAAALAEFRPEGRVFTNAVFQSVFPFLVRRGVELSIERERWETPDGDFLDVDIALPAAPPRGWVVLLHGLEGSSRARYMVGALERAVAHGLAGIAVNFRTCSGVLNRLPRAYHSGDAAEVRFVIGQVRRRFPGLEGGAIGFSLGGSVLLSWLAEEGKAVPPEVRAAVGVSVPFDLERTATYNDRPQHFFVREFFLRTLRAKALAKSARHPGLLDPAAIRAATTIRLFDEVVTAPLHGFRDARDYWRRCSTAPKLGAIAVPCLLLMAADDPIVPVAGVPRGEIARNPHLVYEETPRGGHVGFVAGSPLAPRFYAEERALSFIDSRLGARPSS